MYKITQLTISNVSLISKLHYFNSVNFHLSMLWNLFSNFVTAASFKFERLTETLSWLVPLGNLTKSIPVLIDWYLILIPSADRGRELCKTFAQRNVICKQFKVLRRHTMFKNWCGVCTLVAMHALLCRYTCIGLKIIWDYSLCPLCYVNTPIA